MATGGSNFYDLVKNDANIFMLFFYFLSHLILATYLSEAFSLQQFFCRVGIKSQNM